MLTWADEVDRDAATAAGARGGRPGNPDDHPRHGVVLSGGTAWGEPVRRRHAAAAAGWAADAEGGPAPYIFKDPQNPDKYLRLRGRPGRTELEKELPGPAASSSTSMPSAAWCPDVERGDFDFAMNGLEITPDRRKEILLQPALFILHAATGRPGGRKTLRLAGRVRQGQLPGGHPGGHGHRAAAGSDGDRTSGSTTARSRPYMDLELGRIDAVLLDLPIAVYYAQPNPKLKFVGPAAGQRLLRHRLPQGPAGRWRRSSTWRWTGCSSPANCGESTRSGASGTKTRPNSSSGEEDRRRAQGVRRGSGSSRVYFPLVVERGDRHRPS